MNSLPPAFPAANKVKVRSKTTSFKRPFSCDVNDVTKKESKELFLNLKKGASNSKLNENVDRKDVSKYCFTESNEIQQEKIVGRMQGRKFDSDDEENDILNEETSVTKMAQLFEDYSEVLNNPALLGYLLIYLENHSLDYNDLLFYLVVQHYKITIQLKEFSKDAPRFVNEIITTFIHDKSNLKIDHKINTVSILENLKSNNDIFNIFDETEEILKYCIKKKVDSIIISIRHGLSDLDISVAKANFETKMNFLNKCISNIINNLEDKLIYESNKAITKELKEKVQYTSDIIISIKSSLSTIYYYFSKKGKDYGDNISISSNKHLRTSLMMKSSESLQSVGSSVLDKYPTFCSKIHKKTQSHSFFRKSKTSKGHNFQEYIFKYPAECLFCENLLWGIHPQGLCCSHCQEAVHVNCKDCVRTNCSKEVRRVQGNQSNSTLPIEVDTIKTDKKIYLKDGEDYNIRFDSEVLVTSGINDSTICQHLNDLADNQINIQNDGNKITEKGMNYSISSEILQNFKPNIVVSPTKIFVTNDDIISKRRDSESLDSVSNISSRKQHEYTKTEFQSKYGIEKNFLYPIRYYPKGHVKNMALKFDPPNISRSQSDDNLATRTISKSFNRESQSVLVQDLVTDSSLWANDPDMAIEEIFEADKELKIFTTHLTREQNKEEYIRLLVLMEFHHKIKFTVMTLKRFDYLLIKQWPCDDSMLFKTLSLTCIVPLYELIKTLNFTIEQCKNKTSYSKDMARNIRSWLLANEEANLELWLRYSIDLCCTNSLNLVKNSWKEYIADPKFTQVLTKRHNKMIMVEQLSNMRQLLFNLPLIVSKIHNDLNKFSKFKDETKIWKEINNKLKKYITFIDEHCMPLVQLINNGIIVNGLDRNNWALRLNSNDPYNDYILDFPKTAFHHKLFDFQEIKISDFKESNKNNKTPVVSVKETFDAYAICYDNILVLLQKENEKYYLKQFKGTDTSKINPILVLENVHATKGNEKRSQYELTLIFINVAVLAQITFDKKDVWNRWHDFICQMKLRTLKNKKDNDAPENHITTDTYLEIKGKWEAFSGSHSSVFKDEIKVSDLYEKDVLFQKSSDPNEFVIGTSFDAIQILKICYENLSIFSNYEVLENLLSSISRMEHRISHFMNSRSKDILNTEDIECEMSDMQRDEFPYISLPITPSESINVDSEDDLDISNEEEKLPEINKSNDDEDILLFVNEYVRQIIEETQLIVNNMSSNDIDDHSDKLL